MEGFTDMPKNGRLVVLNSLKEPVTLRSDLCRAESGVEQDCRVCCEPKESAKFSGKKRAAPSSSKASENYQQDEDQDDEEFIPKRLKSEEADAAVQQEPNAEGPSGHAYKPGEQGPRGTRRLSDENKQTAGKDQETQTECGERSLQLIAASAQAAQGPPWLDQLQRFTNDPQRSHLGICRIMEDLSKSQAWELQELESILQDINLKQDFTHDVWEYVTYLRIKKEGGHMPTFLGGRRFVEPMDELGRKLRAQGFKLERPDE